MVETKKKNMNNPIDITSVIPIGMNREQAEKLAQNIANTMRKMWEENKEKGKLHPKNFLTNSLSYCKTLESQKFLAERINKIFSENVIEKIIQSKNDFVTFTFKDEQVTVNAKAPQPA